MYHLYKPLRNRLRTLSLMPSLMGIYRYSLFSQFDQRLPQALRYPNFGLIKPLETGLHDWTLELIARELILHAPESGARAMTSWNEFAELANLIRHIENEIWGSLPNGADLIEYEMMRIAHRQFPWQVQPNSRLFASYFKLYSNPRLIGLMTAAFGMTAAQLFQLAFWISGHFLSNPILRAPVVNQANAVPQDRVERFIGSVSLGLDELRERIRQAQAYNVNWAYAFDPLRTWPIIDLGDRRLFCPMPTLLMWRLTEGIYFDLVRHRKLFDRHFGLAFQDMIGEVVRAADQAGRLQALPEKRYGTRQKPRDSVDWIIQDDTAAIFLECKASRLKAQAKVDVHDTTTIDAEVARLAGFVVQVYATLADAQVGAYPHWKPDGRPIYPMVVTLDDWIPSGHALLGGLDAAVRDGLGARGLDPALLEGSPYTLCSLYEFEAAARAFASDGIQAVMSRKTAGQEQGWALLPFLQGAFPKATSGAKVLFLAEWRDVIAALGTRSRPA